MPSQSPSPKDPEAQGSPRRLNVPDLPLQDRDADGPFEPNSQFSEDVAGPKTSEKMHGVRAKLGLHPRVPVVEDHDRADHSDLVWSRVKLALREPFAEFFGTFILVLFGDGSVAQVLLSNSDTTAQTSAPGANGFGAYQSISWGWGLGVMLGIYVAGDSGAYLNPAVSFGCFEMVVVVLLLRGQAFIIWIGCHGSGLKSVGDDVDADI